VRTQFVDQSVREDGIGPYQDGVRLGQTVKGAMSTLLYSDAVGQ
jgi:hypothetical protein